MNEFLQGLQMFFTTEIIGLVLLGGLAGLFVGAIPGLNDTNILTLFLAFVVYLDPFPGVIMMVALFVASQTAGSIPAILMNIPGTPSTAATTMEGYPLTQKGMAGQALGCSFASSLTGSVCGGILALITAPIIGKFALSFGPPEMFMLAVFGMTAVAALTGSSITKGLLAASLGLLVGCIGLDSFTGARRATFGLVDLYGGVELVPMLLGLYGVSELFYLIYKKSIGSQSGDSEKRDISVRVQMEGFKAAFREKRAMFLSVVIGYIIGVIPGTGATIGSFACYGYAKQASKTPEKFGTGCYEGLVATDTANNACVPGTIVPMLTLGIPGGGTAVILLSAFMMHGLQPGPRFFSDHLVEANAIFITVVAIGILASIAGMLTTKYMIKVVTVPTYILCPLIALFCLLGSYLGRNRAGDLYLMLAFAIIAYFFKKYQYSTATFLLGTILGPIAEPAMFRSLEISNGSFGIFLGRPICVVLGIASFLAISIPAYSNIKKRRQNIELAAPED